VDQLPELPAAWIEHLTGGEVFSEVDYGQEQLDEILTDGEPCRVVQNRLAGYAQRVADGAGHHPAMRDASLAIVGAGRNGHEGAAAALDQLYDQFTADVDRPDAIPDYRRAVDGAIKIVLAEPFDGRRSCCSLPVFTRSEEDAFWNSRATLATIRQFAQARLAAPWSVLGCVLARIVAATDYDVCLPPIVGTNASLNFFLALVGGSSAGKGVSMGVARDVVEIAQPAVKLQVGSGEGLIHAFAVAAKDKDSKQWTVQRIRWNVLFDVSEVDVLSALTGGRSGSTLLGMLRQAWSGEALGRSTASAERNVSIPEHSYRLSLIVGVQPERAGALMADAGGGTPQRFLWLPAHDPEMELGITEPDSIKWQPPRKLYQAGQDQLIKVCQLARDEIQAVRLQNGRGEVGALDGHAMLTREKVAAALGLLERRYSIDEEDWRLAGVIMAKSDETRAEIQSTLRDQAERQSTARGKAAGVQKVAAEETEAEMKITRASQAILHKLDSGEWVSRSKTRKAIRYDLRPVFDDAEHALILTGKVERRPTANGQGEELRKVD
jgi:hypothetical protein